MKFLPLLILLCAVGCSVDGNQRADQVGHTVVGQALARGKDDVCMQNIKQVRMAIELARQQSEDNAPPASLADLKGIPASMLIDPIGKEAYEYDPATGEVKCPHPGHKKY